MFVIEHFYVHFRTPSNWVINLPYTRKTKMVKPFERGKKPIIRSTGIEENGIWSSDSNIDHGIVMVNTQLLSTS